MKEIKGTCSSCLFIRQEWTVGKGPNGKLKMQLGLWCGICDVFKRADGYCDFWEKP